MDHENGGGYAARPYKVAADDAGAGQEPRREQDCGHGERGQQQPCVGIEAAADDEREGECEHGGAGAARRGGRQAAAGGVYAHAEGRQCADGVGAQVVECGLGPRGVRGVGKEERLRQQRGDGQKEQSAGRQAVYAQAVEQVELHGHAEVPVGPGVGCAGGVEVGKKEDLEREVEG